MAAAPNHPPSPSPTSLEDLARENQQLRDRIAAQDELLKRLRDDFPRSVEELKSAVSSIDQRLGSYTPIAEDVMGLKVFEKAKSYLIGWITMGGIATLTAAILAFALGRSEIKTAARGLAEQEVKSYTDQQLADLVKAETQKQVADYMAKQSPNLPDVILQKVNEVVATLPVGERSRQTEITVAAAAVAPHIDLSDRMNAVRDQGAEGSSTGFAVAAAVEYQVLATTGRKVQLSPREIYNLARKAAGTSSTDSGAVIKDTLNVVVTEGAILEEVWPYKPGEFAASPPSAFSQTERFRVKGFRAVKGLDAMKAALGKYGVLVAGITIFNSFLSEQVARDGVVPDPSKKESVNGGHAICIVGYDDDKQLIKFRNQWSAGWGDHGYGYIHYSSFDRMFNDIWALEM